MLFTQKQDKMVAPGAFLQRIDPLKFHLSVLSIALILRLLKMMLGSLINCHVMV